ncbi:PAS domain S-box protein [Leptospira kmetyi]|nr:PAS domain S-box protein [Leptospira kmetyi]TGK26627.1 PAS domain S-box protein [Leptospira kmetyi]
MLEMLEKKETNRSEMDKVKREYLYRQITKQFPNGGVAVFDRNLRYIIFEGRGLTLVELTSEFVQGKTMREVFPKDICDLSEPLYHAALEGRSTTIEIPYMGRIFKLEHAPIESENGEIDYGLVMAQDITARKKAEDALKDSELDLRALFSAMTDIILVMDSTGRYLKIAPTKAKFLTASPKELLGNRVRDFFASDKADLAENTIRKTLQTGKTQNIEYDLEIHGETLWFEASVSYRSENTVYWVARNITQFKQIENAEKKSQKHLRDIIDGLLPNMFVGLIQPDGVLIEVNKAPLTAAKLRFEDVLGKPFDQTYWWSFSDRSRELLRESIRRACMGETLRYDTEIRVAEEEIIVIDFALKPMRDETGVIKFLIASGTVITDRKKAEAALQESQQKYKELVENINDVIFSANVLCNVTYISPIIQSLTGYSSETITGSGFKDLILEEDREFSRRLISSALSGSRDMCECRMKLKDGGSVWVQISVRPIFRDGTIVGFAGVIMDITKRRQLEQRLLRGQKLESLGTLAGGIAHDFNNLLGIMSCHLSILQDEGSDILKHFKSREAISKTIQRGADLVGQLLTIARKGDMTLEPVHLNSVIFEVVNLMDETFPKLIEVDLTMNCDLPQVLADHSQIHQVLLNLCVNARDAMEPGGGKIIIGTKTVKGEDIRGRHEKAEAPLYLELSVSDTGIGMDSFTKARIFEPFFTTKESGRGTGLGLATTYGIVERHRGFIEVDSALGKGTTFKIFLPAQTHSYETVVKETKQEIVNGTSRRGSGNILLVEDEDMLREVLTSILEQEGYNVTVAGNGLDAVEIYRAQWNRIDLVLSDVGLPGIEGDRMYYEMKRINPEVRAILASGFIEPSKKSELLKAGVLDILQKPYLTVEILNRIKTMIHPGTWSV